MPTLVKHSSGVYYIVFSRKGKRIWKTLSTRDRNLAMRRFIDLETSDPSGTNESTHGHQENPKQDSPVTLQKAIDEYLLYAKSNFTINTYEGYVYVTKLFIKFFGPDTPVKSITTRDIERYKNAKNSGKLSPHTVNYELRCFKAFFNTLVRWSILEKNPCVGIRPLRTDDTIRPYLQRDELQKLLAHTLGSFLHRIILFALLTGLRLGEIVNFTWDDILLDKRKIVVRSKSGFRTKTGKMRVLPINSELYKLLIGMQNKTGLVFKQADGKPFRDQFISKRFKDAVRKCDLNPKLHFHSLRHTFGSYLVEQGVSLFHVQQLMGHSSPFVTQIYAHLGSAELMSSVEKLNIGITS